MLARALRARQLFALDAGFQQHLAKPIEPADLVAAVRALAAPPQG